MSKYKTLFIDMMQAFQQSWEAWMRRTYPDAITDDPVEAADRFAEEAMEAMQAFDIPLERAMHMLQHVYSREKGDPAQEAAGALNCLATLCNVHKINLGQAAIADLDYCEANSEAIRAKNSLKPRFTP